MREKKVAYAAPATPIFKTYISKAFPVMLMRLPMEEMYMVTFDLFIERHRAAQQP